MRVISKIITKHAKERIDKRFKIPDDKILFLLENNFGKIIGRSYDFRVHYLIWSTEDQCCIILINNNVNDCVVTALNEEMYLNTYPEMGERILKNKNKIINMMIYNDLESKDLWTPDSRPSLIYAEHFLDGVIKLNYLSIWEKPIEEYNLSYLGLSNDFWVRVEEGLIKKNISINKVISIKVKIPDGPFFEIKPSI